MPWATALSPPPISSKERYTNPQQASQAIDRLTVKHVNCDKFNADKFQMLVRSPFFFHLVAGWSRLFAVENQIYGGPDNQTTWYIPWEIISFYLLSTLFFPVVAPHAAGCSTACAPLFCCVSLQNSNLEQQRATSWIEMPHVPHHGCPKKEIKPPTAASSACPLHLIPTRQGGGTAKYRVKKGWEPAPPHNLERMVIRPMQSCLYKTRRDVWPRWASTVLLFLLFMQGKISLPIALTFCSPHPSPPSSLGLPCNPFWGIVCC